MMVMVALLDDLGQRYGLLGEVSVRVVCAADFTFVRYIMSFESTLCLLRDHHYRLIKSVMLQ